MLTLHLHVIRSQIQKLFILEARGIQMIFTYGYHHIIPKAVIVIRPGIIHIMKNNGYDAVDIDDSGEDRFIKNRRE